MANPTPAQVAQAEKILSGWMLSSRREYIVNAVAAAIATAHAEGRRAALEEAAAIVMAEKLSDVVDESDRTYQRAVRDCVNALNRLRARATEAQP